MDQEVTIPMEQLIKYKVDSEKLEIILKLIFNASRKYSYDDKLTIGEDNDLMTYLKIVESEKYYNKLNEYREEEAKD